MNQSLNQRIRERAYEIWRAHGCPDGQAEQHWLAAECEILHDDNAIASAPQVCKISDAPKSIAAQVALVKKSKRTSRKKTAAGSPSA
jgi:hypothetical protein